MCKLIITAQNINMNTIDKIQEDFNYRINPFGSRDVETAIKVLNEVSEKKEYEQAEELIDLLEQEAEGLGMQVKDLDVVVVVFEMILQEARNEIEKKTGYDFMNDLTTNTTEIYVSGNYLATTFDYSQEAGDELAEKIKESGKMEELRKNKKVTYLLDSLDIY